MWPYNQNIDPPAPFLPVVVLHPITGESHTLVAKLDTAADISAIPETLRNNLNLNQAQTIPVEGYDGVRTSLPTYIITLELAGAQARHLEVIAIPEDHMLIGRDVLNHFYAKLNGPELTFDLSLAPL